jgi:hypothetical protein
MIELDGSLRLAWAAEGFTTIRIFAPRRERAELLAFARAVADAALVERTVGGLRTALQRHYPGAFELRPQRLPREGEEPYLVVTLDPPRGEPNPDPDF